MTISSPILNKVLIMIAMVACYAMIFIDESGIAVTLAKIQHNLLLSSNAMHWIVNSYLLVLAVLLLLGGKLSDIYGRRNMFTLGIGIFLIASLLCACAPSDWMLISGRVLQGVGASLLMPCIVVLIQQNVPENEFGKAFGIILTSANFFYAMGPFIGGALTEFASWRWFFGINIPIGLICLYLVYLTIAKDSAKPNSVFSDFKGLIVLIISLTALVSAFMQGADLGWSNSWIIGLFIIAVAGLILFIKTELKAKEPLLEIRLFKIKNFFAGIIIFFCSSICLTILIFFALWSQASLHFSPALVGVALLPATIPFIFVPTLGGAWCDKKGARAPMLLGTCLILLGIIWMIVTIPLQSYAWLFLGLLLLGFGIPLAVPNSVTTVMTSVPAEQGGMASGALWTVRQFSFSFGFAIMSATIASYNNKYFTQLLSSSTDYAQISLSQLNLLLVGKNTITQLNSAVLAPLKQAAEIIYTHAFCCSVMAMAVFAIIACIFTCVFIKRKS